MAASGSESGLLSPAADLHFRLMAPVDLTKRGNVGMNLCLWLND